MYRTKYPLELDLMLDSGAFSAHNKGKEINLDEYIAYIKEYQEYLTCYVNLDIIGDAEATMRNQRAMEAAGLSPMPVFHIGEEFSYLKALMDEYDYIGIGGIANLSGTGESFKFLNQVFGIVCDKNGYPTRKLHAFGITNTESIFGYPWYSVDSTSWLYSSRMGLLYIPRRLQNGEWDLLETTGKYFKPSITLLSPFLSEPGKHILNSPPAVKRLYDEWLECHGWVTGKSEFHKESPDYVLKKGERWVAARGASILEKGAGAKTFVETILEVGLSNDYTSRDIANATYFKELQEHIPEYPWKWNRPKMKGFLR